VGVSKELCPNLIALGDKVAFAKDFALYLTYKHRKNSIAGGEIEDMDFDLESPNTGYLAMIREEDGRVPTPSIEVGAATNRFKHIGVVNVPRVSSEFGKQMRGMFKVEKGKVFFGMDYASLEARIMGHYVYDYEGGQEEASMYTAEKPNDWHTQVSLKVGMDRGNTKNLNYGLIYGAQPNKISKMVNCDLDRANELYNDLWNAVPGLKKRKQELENEWESTGKKYIKSIDGRRINIRSKHSLLNFLFQSSGSIFAKYVFIFIMEAVEKMGYNTDPTKGEIDIGSMISMHDEEAFEITPKILNFKTFGTEEEAKDFVKNWEGEQLSGVLKGKKDYYVCLPNDLSKIVTKAVKRAEEHLNIKVPMGFEWLVGNNWAECH
jgi:DNA polymerase I-like protein with 3'-5' exonuclease and polymerase domains